MANIQSPSNQNWPLSSMRCPDTYPALTICSSMRCPHNATPQHALVIPCFAGQPVATSQRGSLTVACTDRTPTPHGMQSQHTATVLYCGVQDTPHFEQPPLPPFPHPHPPPPSPLSCAFILCQAAIPPDTFETFLNPKTLLSRTVACADLWPDAHTTAMLLVW